jgi:streptogramin lyase
MSISTICRRFVPALGVLAVAGMLAGCSGASQNAGVGVPQAGGNAFPGPALRSGVYARFAGPAQAQARSNASPLTKIERDLFVSSGGNDVLALKDGSYKSAGEITSGVDGSDGIWVDNHGNLYVSNFNSATVTEYAPGGSSPICTYSGMLDPTNVTTDDAGNVYVVDFYVDQNPGYIDKFAQCSDTISQQYPISSGPQGVAVDRHGDIFVSYYSHGGAFVEFKHGSSQATPLGVTTVLPGGLVLDKNDNLVADDDNSIVVIAPPYTSATPIVTSVSGPFRDSLNRKEDLLFSANTGSNTVTVYRYPSGQLVTTLGASNGITSPLGVAESPNATF